MKEKIKEHIGYCFNCEEEVDIDVVEYNCETKVKDEKICTKKYKCICKKCGQIAVNETIESINDNLVFNKYKEIKGLLLPYDIKQLREKYALSQTNLAKLLNFGEKSIARYESGSIQDDSHDLLLKMIKNEVIFKYIWEINKHKLDQSAIDKTEKCIYHSSKCFEYSSTASTLNTIAENGTIYKGINLGGKLSYGI